MRSVAATCEHLDWSPIESAASHSQLAGVIASLLFAGMIVLLTDRGKTIKHTYALMLLTSSFFILALDSFLFSVIAGERHAVAHGPRLWSLAACSVWAQSESSVACRGS
ncbi:hypothetical protein GKC29_02385 [Micromonospora sp. WMMC415]|uniref:hypothetical protein n=1 Tax=Micromonospora sp. WMMC415 TaxID=2675222 RepID=UPI0012B4888D|nr:hypothetical protein [Micromonospora sp. WMMC415]QGN45814.1 hypothetical protein GKC29_02385 [Micromonospora sp. WMMC415]